MAKNKATLNINPDLHRELKIEAAKQGTTIAELGEKFLRKGLKETRP